MSQSCCSLGFLSQNSLDSSLHFMGIRVFIVGYVRNVKSQFSSKQGILATWPRDWNESQDNFQVKLYFLSYNAPTVMTLQLPTCFTRVPLWRLSGCEIQSRYSFEFIHLEFSSHSLTHSHLNTRYLIAKLQANFVHNKANT